MARLHRMKPEVAVDVIRTLAIQQGVSEPIAAQVAQQLLPIYQTLYADGNFFVCEEGKSQVLNWLLQQHGAQAFEAAPPQHHAPAPPPPPQAPRVPPPNPAAARVYTPPPSAVVERPRAVPGGPVPVQAPMMPGGGNGSHNPPPAPLAPPVL